MPPIHPTESRSYWSYLNPLNIFKIPSYIYQTIFQRSAGAPLASLAGRELVVYREAKLEGEENGVVLIEEVRYSNLHDLLAQTSRPYPIQEINLYDLDQADHVRLNVAKHFLSDIERSGEPDRFLIDGEEVVPPPKTEEQKKELLIKILQIAQGDQKKVEKWTEIWNYRLKIDILNGVIEDFRNKFSLNPIFGRDSYQSVVISLDTQKNSLSCKVEGKIEKALTIEDVQTEKLPEIREGLKFQYKANISCDLNADWVEKRIDLFDDNILVV